jgi:hypothetical protein
MTLQRMLWRPSAKSLMAQRGSWLEAQMTAFGTDRPARKRLDA